MMFNAIPRDLAGLNPFMTCIILEPSLTWHRIETLLRKSDLELFYMIAKKSDYYSEGMFELAGLLLRSNKPESGIEMLVKIWEDAGNTRLSIKSGIPLTITLKKNLFNRSDFSRNTTVEDDELKKDTSYTQQGIYQNR